MSMAAENAVRDAVVTIFRDKLGFEVPSAETDLFEAGIMDSLKFVDLLFHLEQELGVAISMETVEIDHFRTIANVAQFVERSKRLNDANASLH